MASGIVWTVALTWGVNHRTEDLPLCLSSLYILLSNKNKINLLKKRVAPSAVVQVLKFLAMYARDPTWAQVLIPAAPSPIQLPACGPGKQSMTAQSFGTLHHSIGPLHSLGE